MPLINLQPGDEKPERIDLFTIDDVTYSIPAKVPMHLSLKYLRTLRDKGEQVAGYQAVENLLGTEAMTALENYEDLTPEQYEQILRAANEVILGSQTEGKAPKKTGRR